MQKITIEKILKKKNKTPIVCLTAYSKAIAQIADRYCDIILVGDSLGMVLYGMKTTRNIKIETMILHAKTVKNYSKRLWAKDVTLWHHDPIHQEIIRNSLGWLHVLENQIHQIP